MTKFFMFFRSALRRLRGQARALSSTSRHTKMRALKAWSVHRQSCRELGHTVAIRAKRRIDREQCRRRQAMALRQSHGMAMQRVELQPLALDEIVVER